MGTLASKMSGSIFNWQEKNVNGGEANQLKEKNIALIQENAQLKEKIRSDQKQFSNDTLKTNYSLTEASIIGKDNFFNTPIFFILGGKDKGLRDGLPVLDGNGVLVGTIQGVQEKISQVALTPNHQSRIGGRIAGSDWDGVVEGNRDLRAVLEMLPLESKINNGDQVVTDNRNPDIPQGIVIGTVAAIKESDDHLFNQALLDLPWESNNLDKVWVILGRK